MLDSKLLSALYNIDCYYFLRTKNTKNDNNNNSNKLMITIIKTGREARAKLPPPLPL